MTAHLIARQADAPGASIYTPHRRRLSADETEHGRERDESSIDFDATLWPQPGAVLGEAKPEEWEEDVA